MTCSDLAQLMDGEEAANAQSHRRGRWSTRCGSIQPKQASTASLSMDQLAVQMVHSGEEGANLVSQDDRDLDRRDAERERMGVRLRAQERPAPRRTSGRGGRRARAMIATHAAEKKSGAFVRRQGRRVQIGRNAFRPRRIVWAVVAGFW